jgi:2-amino-4-hydroxy-6-hydroxymethyldihydropteridine diphosphokinase
VTRIKSLIAKALRLIRRDTKVGRVIRAFVGLGSNLGDREGTLRAAVERLRRVAGTWVVKVSAFRDTRPVGYVDQPRFLNGAVELETSLAAPALLEELLAIERELGRDRSAVPPQGPRTLDLDLLVYGDETICEPGLEVPHPRLHERAFVLEPLVELDPGLEIPGRGPVQALLAKLDSPA